MEPLRILQIEDSEDDSRPLLQLRREGSRSSSPDGRAPATRTSLRILIIEDSEDDALLLVHELRRGGFDPVFERVDTREALEVALNNHTWDVITVDYSLPGFSGLVALDLVRDRGLDFPLIIVSGRIGEELAVEALKNGACDYVPKSDLSRLVPSIQREMREAEVRRQRRRVEEELVMERSRLGDVIDNSNCGLLLLDEQGRVTFANRLSEEWFGSLDEIKGKLSWEVFGLKNAERESAALKVIRTGKPVDSEKFARIVNGEKKYFYVSATPLKDDSGKVSQVTEVVMDITERKRAEQLKNALNDISVAINSTLDFDEIMRRVTVLAAKALRIGSASISLPADDAWIVSHRSPEKYIGMRYTNAESPLVALAVASGKPVISGDTLNDARVDPEIARKYGTRAVLALPLLARQQTVGMLQFADESATRLFTEVEIDFAVRLAGSLSLALENARLFAAERQSKELNEALNAISAAIGSTLDFEEIIRIAVGEAAEKIGCETAAVSLKEGGRWVLRAVYGVPEEGAVGKEFAEAEAEAAAVAFRAGRPLVMNDVSRDPTVFRTLLEERSIRSLLAVPLLAGEDVIGILSVHQLSGPVVFTEAQVDFCRKLAAILSLALENARLYGAQRSIAKTLQEALLVVPQSIEGIEFGYLYRSATEHASVGGDFFDVFELGDRRVGLMVGDVSGKGVEAATFASFVRHSVKAYANQVDSPATVMALASELVEKMASSSAAFVTIFFGILDIPSKTIIYCSAGHPPALLKTKSGIRRLSVSSPIIGAYPLIYRDGREVMEEDDILFVYTDGVTEARRKADLFGEARLVKLIKKMPNPSVREFPEQVLREVMTYSSGRLFDDIAMLAVSLAEAGGGYSPPGQ